MSSPSVAFTHETGGSEHWLSPAKLIAELEVRAGMTVAEIGPGAGYYTLPLAREAGTAGFVYAVEWRTWLLDELRARLRAPEAPKNIRVIAGRPAATHLDPGSCDMAILAGIWHELENRHAALDEARRILKPEGRLALLDWAPGGLCPPGPPNEHRIPMQTALGAVERESWSLIHRYTCEDGYLLVFEMADESLQS